MSAINAISVHNLGKTYKTGFTALSNISLDIRKGEIFALLGPNGAGKTTLINAICGLVNVTQGTVHIMGHDAAKDYRAARKCIGLVPQELTTDAFETIWNNVSFSRGLFGFPPDPAYIETLLNDLSLSDKKHNQVRTLSGGMKRRMMIAKALSHQPAILFLDEPTAGVDVELRKSMWAHILRLREEGVTIILTTHYLEEAEEVADRIGIINKGKIILIEEKESLMKKLGKKELLIDLTEPLSSIPEKLAPFQLALGRDGFSITYTYNSPEAGKNPQTGVSELLFQLQANNIPYKDIQTRESSLEEIFVQLTGGK